MRLADISRLSYDYNIPCYILEKANLQQRNIPKIIKDILERRALEKAKKSNNKIKKPLPDNFYNSKMWFRKRVEILKRDNQKCLHCGELANHVCHFNSAKFFPEIALCNWNLYLSCERCHKLYHGKKWGTV